MDRGGYRKTRSRFSPLNDRNSIPYRSRRTLSPSPSFSSNRGSRYYSSRVSYLPFESSTPLLSSVDPPPSPEWGQLDEEKKFIPHSHLDVDLPKRTNSPNEMLMLSSPPLLSHVNRNDEKKEIQILTAEGTRRNSFDEVFCYKLPKCSESDIIQLVSTIDNSTFRVTKQELGQGSVKFKRDLKGHMVYNELFINYTGEIIQAALSINLRFTNLKHLDQWSFPISFINTLYTFGQVYNLIYVQDFCFYAYDKTLDRLANINMKEDELPDIQLVADLVNLFKICNSNDLHEYQGRVKTMCQKFNSVILKYYMRKKNKEESNVAKILALAFNLK